MSYKRYLDVVRNDFGYAIEFEISDENGDAINLSNVVAIGLHVWRYGEDTLELDAECSVVDSTAGTCKYIVQSGDLVNDGKFKVELERSYSDRVVTDKEITMIVWPDYPE